MLKGKTVVLGVTGSIAAYKMANLTSMLIKLHCDVHVIMTKNATNIINPITFETLTGHKCLVDTFDRNFNYNIEHVALGDKADLMLVAPAMNTNMYENPIVQHNLQRLREFGMEVIEPDTGILACKAVGKGKLPSEEILLEYILREIHLEKDLEGKKVLVTAGATREAIDPVRFITNHSTGKMGYALAKVAMYRGAEVTLVSAPTQLQPPICVKLVRVESAEDMFREVKKLAPDMDIIIKAAAVADFTPVEYHEGKIKKKEGESTLELKRTQDILAYLGARRRQGQYICGFSMETENMIENSQQKLKDKHVDLIVANNLNTEGAGFASDTNIVTLIMEEGLVELPCMSKEEVAATIFDVIVKK